MRISRTFNYTGRKKLGRSAVQIRLLEAAGKRPEFQATFSLSDYRLPPGANVYVEAYRGDTVQRFDFGTVSLIQEPESTRLDEIDLSGQVLFRVKIVYESSGPGLVLALADSIKPASDDDRNQRTSLMTFRTGQDMGQMIWKLDFEDQPVLSINDNIPDAKNQLMSNPLLQSLILPVAFREVLCFIFWNHRNLNDVDEDSWEQRWLDFAGRYAAIDLGDLTDDADAQKEWIEDVVKLFSSEHAFCKKLISRLEADDD